MVQCFSKSRGTPLTESIGRTEPSGCSCSSATPKRSMHASQHTWKGRDPSLAASKSEKTQIGRTANSASISGTITSMAGENSNVTPFLTTEVIRWIRLDKSRRNFR